jgi:UDP-N-acetylmuramate--alanine ligase
MNDRPSVPHIEQIPHRVHLVGVGGAHMSAIAEILVSHGHEVSGSDLRASPVTERLAARGVRVTIGHDAAHVNGADLVVTTAAARADNPELVAARQQGIPVITRAQMVALLMRGRRGIAIAGTHGKTTTTGLVAHLLVRAGRAPTYLIGGDIPDLGGNWAVGQGDEIVVEADEYARAFLEYEPQIAVVTNIEADHLEYFGSQDALVDAFADFLRRVRAGGLVLTCEESPLLRDLMVRLRSERGHKQAVRTSTYAVTEPADWTATEIAASPAGEQSFLVWHEGRPYGRFTIRLPGRHNITNALAAIAVAHDLGLTVETTRSALAAYRGARRRFDHLGAYQGVEIVDDFAHHPTEIRATLAAARQRFPGRRIIVVFQPHTYSRTAYLLDGFLAAFRDADALAIVETYAARETPDQGMSAEQMAALLREPPATYLPSLAAIHDYFFRTARPGDVFLTLGAGDIAEAGPEILRHGRDDGGSRC